MPVSLKNNSAITVTSKNVRSGFQKIVHRPNLLQPKLPTPIRHFTPGQRLQELKIRPLGSNVQQKYFPIIRGRSPHIRPTRPIPIQNRMNLKMPSIPGGSVEAKDGEFLDMNEEGSLNIESETSNQMQNVEFNSTVSRSSQDSYNSENNSDTLESNNTHQNIGSTLEEAISEDSSQEKVYADLSDKGESKIMVNKKSPTKLINNTNTFLEDCKIPIKTNFNPLNPADVSFVNEVTIKRTGITNSNPQNSFEYTKRSRSDIVNVFSDDNLSSENSFSECRVPIQSGFADENSQEDDYHLKDKTHYKPHVDKTPKISSLKNYRHTKPMPKSNQSGDYSPTSVSSTPTPPPASTSGYMPSTGTSPIILHDKFESSLSQLEKATSSINPPSNSNQLSNFQQSLSDITKTYPQDISDSGIYKPGPKSRKKKFSPAVTPDNATSPVSNDLQKKQLQSETAPQSIVHSSVSSYPSFQQQPIAESIPLSRESDPSYPMQTPDAASIQQPYSAYPGKYT